MGWKLIAVGFVLLALLAGCSGDSDSDPQDAFCADLSDVQGDLKSLGDAVTSLNRSRVESAVDDLESSVNDVRESGQELRAGEAGPVESAYDAVRDAVNSLGQGGGIGAQLSALQSSVTALVNAVSAAVSAYSCK